MAGWSDLIGTAGASETRAQAITGDRQAVKPSRPTDKGGKASARSKGKQSASKPRKQSTASTPLVEMVAGDVVQTSGGAASSLMPSSVEDVARMAPAWIGEWCELHAVQDMVKASPLIYRAMCQDIGARYIKPSGILKDTRPRGTTPTGGASTCGAYNPRAVSDLYNVFCRICGEFDKVPFASSFAGFSGVSLSYIREYTEGLTSAGLDLRQKTHAAEMDAIRQSASRDPVGRLAILNNEHWGTAQEVKRESVQARALPRFDGSGGVIG